MNSIFDTISTSRTIGKFFNRSFILIVLVALYIPLLFFVLLSFNSPSSKNTVSTVIGQWNGINNYIDFFSNGSENVALVDALVNSLTIALISIPISLFIGLLTTISLWRNYGKGQKLIFLASNTTISCPDIIQAIAFSLLFSIFAIPLGFFTVVLTHIAFQIPYVVIFLYPKLSKLNLNLLLASYDLNYKFFESVVNVILPSLFPNLVGASILAFTVSFDDYIITNLVRGNLTTVSTELYNMKTGIKLWSAVFGSLLILVVLLLIVSINLYNGIKKKKHV